MKLVIGNQKAYLTKEQLTDFVEKIKNLNNNNVIICPSSIYFGMFDNVKVLLGAQDVSKFDGDATTGDISFKQLKSMNINFSIVGHSERRQLLKESIEDTNIKVKKLLDNNMIPILCVGETIEEKNSGVTKQVIFDEISGALKDVPNNCIDKLIIAYEPIWSIGTGNVPTNDEIDNVIRSIKKFLLDEYESNNIVLYGGSVNTKNVDELNTVSSIDGYLIGGASTKAVEFLQIIDKCS